MAKNSKISNETFVNPYNFISLQGKCSKGKDYIEIKKPEDSSDLLTGWIECDMETLTPIFIPNTSDSKSDVFGQKTNEGKTIKSYDFFSYTNLDGVKEKPAPPLPVIPGSEIRGMIRSAFEVLTNSCFSTIDKDRPLYKRTTSPAEGCGILNFDNNTKKWVVWKCKKYRVAIRRTKGNPNDFSSIVNGLYDGQEVYIKTTGKKEVWDKKANQKNKVPIFEVVDDIKTIPTQGYTRGWFHKGEKFGDTNRKHHESVFVLENPDKPEFFSVPNEAVECLLKNFKLYNDPKINAHKKSGHHNGYENIANDLEKKVNELKTIDLNGLPVYYATHKGTNGEDYYYLSPAQIGREVFYNTLDKILENNGGYKPCTNRKDLCSACALFGTAAKDNSAASRVRFTDALIPEDKKLTDNSKYFEEDKILPELASPKPSAVEFYLKRPADNGRDKVAIWNYDYAVIWKNGNKKEEMINYQPHLRGRKFYWHQKINEAPFLDLKNEKDKQKISDRNVAVRPLKKGVDFKFKVYFKNIKEEELKQLLWTLEIGGNKDKAHKIGMGKPLGLGSVRIQVSDVMIRKVELNNEFVNYKIYSKNEIIEQVRKENKIESLLGCNKDVLDEFLKITDYKNAPANVMYPCNKGSDKTYEWFVSNKIVEGTGGTGTNPFINQELPSIKNPNLKKYT